MLYQGVAERKPGLVMAYMVLQMISIVILGIVVFLFLLCAIWITAADERTREEVWN